jgi:hypothetical protein
MALQLSTTVRDARLDVIETTIGTSAILKIRTGAIPADCAAADTGTVLATLSLPSDYMAAASGGSKAKSGTWQDSSADATGMGGHFRLYESTATTCHLQGLLGQNWQASTAYALNQQVINDSGKCYKCITAGTSAGSGGPTGTGSDITDGTVHWQYIGTADMTVDNDSFAAGQNYTITTFTLNDANA